jgi:hypothetical protein
MTYTNTQPRNPTDTPRRPRLQISATQLVASALAAVTTTIAASYLGVSGTVVGAAVASVLTVTGNAVYVHSLNRTRERVRTAVPTTARWLPPSREPDPAAIAPVSRPSSPLLRRLALASVAIFAAVLALVTSVELVAGRPLSDLLHGRSGQGTTVFGPSHQQDRPKQPTPTVTETVIPTIVTTTPTITRTAPPVTTTNTPTASPSAPAPSTGGGSSSSSAPAEPQR